MFKTPTDPTQLQARQLARLVFGLALIAGAVRMVIAVVIDAHEGELDIADLLLQTWLSAFIGGVAWRIGAQYLPRTIATRAGRHRLFVASCVVPAVGAALVLPLTVHLVYYLAFDKRGFDEWAALSMIFAGLAHVVFATMLGFRAADLARGTLRPLGIPALYGATVGAGMLPLPIITSAIIALTGLPILPLLIAMKPYIERERLAAFPDHEIPLAIATAAAA